MQLIKLGTCYLSGEMRVKAELIKLEIETINSVSTLGSYVGLFMDFSGPITSYVNLPADWLNEYTTKGYAINDPYILWGQNNTGFIRWSDVNTDTNNQIANAAKAHGIDFGATASLVIEGKRSIGIFLNKDREFSTQELNILNGSLRKLHLAHSPTDTLTDLEIKTLHLLIEGNSAKEVANILKVADQTVKLRLLTLRRKFGVRTNVELAVVASKMKMV